MKLMKGDDILYAMMYGKSDDDLIEVSEQDFWDTIMWSPRKEDQDVVEE